MILRASHVYLTNTALLVGHQVDAGIRRDWLEFGLPSGEQAFIASNVILFLIVLFGFGRVVERSVYAPGFSLCLALTGILTFFLDNVGVQMGLHSHFVPLSQTLLWGILAVSLLQGWMAWREFRTHLHASR